MHVFVRFAAPFVMALAVASCGPAGPSTGTTPPGPGTGAAGFAPASTRERALWGPHVAAACPNVPRGMPQCLALVRTDVPARMHPGTITGITPQQFQKAYHLPSASKGAGQIVAVVDAFDNPNAASDLATYRAQFGLPASTFVKYNQNGQTSNYPPGDMGWGTEIDLDVQMVAASCPNCTIYLVEANGADGPDLQAAEATAVSLGAHIVTNSWICYGSIDCVDVSDFDTPGVTYVASSGDEGFYEPGAPMAFGSVVAVGGTTLTQAHNRRGWSETAWIGSGSGCVTGIAKPKWQHDPSCTSRMAADVAADGDPITGAAMYDSYGSGGWVTNGGTSLATPLVAGMFALAGDATHQNGGRTFWRKIHGKRHLFAVTSGNTGNCSPAYYCKDGTNEYGLYGGPTGWGTPDGIGQL